MSDAAAALGVRPAKSATPRIDSKRIADFIKTFKVIAG
jgi:hypothetical protein